MSVDNTLKARESNYGVYEDLATLSQDLKAVVRTGKTWHRLEPHMQESLDMICHKMARILNGNPYHVDSWHDIAGYAVLVEQTLDDGKND